MKKAPPEIATFMAYMDAKPNEWSSLIGSEFMHKCGEMGRLVRIEHHNGNPYLCFRFERGRFFNPEPQFLPDSFKDGTLRPTLLPNAVGEKIKRWLHYEETSEYREKAKVRLARTISQNNGSFPLPAQLQNYIAEEIGWTYNPKKGAYKRTDDVLISDYMGTYFPRSFVEAYSMFALLMQKQPIADSLLGNPKLSIIDIGSGTGGNLLGFLWALKDYCLVSGYSLPNIKVTSIEKNEPSLNIQQELITEFFPDHVNVEAKLSTFSSGENLLKDLTDNTILNGAANLIMCWKFICEFYDPIDRYMQNNGMYGDLLKIGNKHLKENGILAICDVTWRAYDPDGGFLPCILNREVHKILLSKMTDLVPILPLSCAHWYEHCTGYVDCFIQKHFNVSHSALPAGLKQDGQGVSLKVFARKAFAGVVLQGENAADEYVTGHTSKGHLNTCRLGRKEHIPLEQQLPLASRPFVDGFRWINGSQLP